MKRMFYFMWSFILLLSFTSCDKKDDLGASVAKAFITNYHQIENYELTYELDKIVEKMMNEPEKYLIIHNDNFAEATDQIIDEMKELLFKHFHYQISDSLAESLHLNRYIRNVVTSANEGGYTITINKITLEEVKSSVEDGKVYNHNTEITINNYDGSTENQNIKGQILLKKENDEWIVYQYTEK